MVRRGEDKLGGKESGEAELRNLERLRLKLWKYDWESHRNTHD